MSLPYSPTHTELPVGAGGVDPPSATCPILVSYNMQPERRIVQRIQAYLEGRGARPFKIFGEEGSYQEAGIPDLLVCYRGVFIGVEVKQPGGEASPLQKRVLRSIESAGGIAAVVESVEQVEHLLSKVDKKR